MAITMISISTKYEYRKSIGSGDMIFQTFRYWKLAFLLSILINSDQKSIIF